MDGEEKSTPNIWEVLKPEAILLRLKEKEKEKVIEELVTGMAEAGLVSDKTTTLQNVLARERMMSTGIGEGVAIPHAKDDLTTQPLVAFGYSKEGITFESVDGRKVHLIFLLLSPKSDPAGYIKFLGKIARLLDNRDLRESLKKAQSPQDVIAIMKAAEESLP